MNVQLGMALAGNLLLLLPAFALLALAPMWFDADVAIGSPTGWGRFVDDHCRCSVARHRE